MEEHVRTILGDLSELKLLQIKLPFTPKLTSPLTQDKWVCDDYMCDLPKDL